MKTIHLLLTSLIALQCLAFVVQNLLNLEPALGYVETVLGRDGQQLYPASILPPIRHPAAIRIVLAIIILAELAAGLLAARGTWLLWAAWQQPPAIYAKAMQQAAVACGYVLAVWLGLFLVIGHAFFQMWQTEAGTGALNGAFQNAVMAGLVMLLLING